MPNTQQIPRIEQTPHIQTVSSGIIAGAAGGLAEIAWVTLYAGATGGNAAVLARGVTSAVGVSALLPQSAVTLGIAVHMTLAVALGVALGYVWRALRAHEAPPSAPIRSCSRRWPEYGQPTSSSFCQSSARPSSTWCLTR